ncbi:MAG: diguanylate cyclase, partial [Desulfobulbaceae bacterium]|nr:diguanylate cyclase [Desulfobulbaceae bacterium]
LEVVDIADEKSLKERPYTKRVIASLKAGDVVGEMGMIRSCKRSATVIAAEPAELLTINEKMIKRLQWLYPPAAQRFFFNLMTVLCDRLENTTTCFLEETATDRLTSLHPLDFSMEMLEKEIVRSQRDDLPLAMIVICMDNLMEIVGENRYKIGDAVITDTTNLLKSHIREADFLCRVDREWFCLVLPRTTEKEGAEILERVKALFSALSLQMDGKIIDVRRRFRLFSYETQLKKDAVAFVGDALRLMKDNEISSISK